jgi:hypothetical protein
MGTPLVLTAALQESDGGAGKVSIRNSNALKKVVGKATPEQSICEPTILLLLECYY